jgi:hypothetical protein
MNRTFASLILCLFCFLSPTIQAETPEEKGLRLAREIEAAGKGFIGERSRMKMILIDAHGSRVERQMTGMTMEVDGDGDRSLINFESPLDVQGTKMLTWSKKTEDDEQWLYLPSVRRVKRITSRQQSASFLGSEFSYEDLGSQEVDKYTYKWIRDHVVDGKPVWIIERFPKRTSGYSKQVLTVRQDIKAAVKVEYFDRRGELLKVAEFLGYREFKVGGRTHHRPSSIHMKNVQTRKESIFEWQQREIGVAHNATDFEQRNLR